MSRPNPADGLPLLADPRLRIQLSHEEQQQHGVIRLFFDEELILLKTLGGAKWIFLFELIQAAQSADGQLPELAFVPTIKLVNAVALTATRNSPALTTRFSICATCSPGRC